MDPSRAFLATTGTSLKGAVRAADGTWAVETRLEGTYVTCLASDPHNAGVVYAGTQGGGVLRSEDRGATWRPSGMDGQIVKAVAASPTTPGVVYAGTKPASVFVSRDAGQHWIELESFRQMRRWWWLQPAEVPLTTYISALTLSPTDANVIMAGVEACGVFRSADGGQSWAGHLKGSVRDCHSLAFHARNGEWVYEAGGSGGGTAFSRNGGRTWAQPRAGLDCHYGWACAGDPAQPDIWYASLSPMSGFPKMIPAAHVDGEANAHIFRRRGDGPWEKLSGGLPEPLNYMAYALVTDPAAPGHLYAGLSNGDVWQTDDYGDTWQQLPFNLTRIGRTLILV